jgi:hypothetical protein
MLSACGRHTKKVEELKIETDRLAGEINQIFVTARENLVLRARMVQDAYEHKDRYDLSTEGMDVSEGGVYDWFEDWFYVPTEDKFNGRGMINLYNGNNGMYLDPDVEYMPENFAKARKIATDGPELELIKREMRLWEYIIGDVMEAGKDLGYAEYTYFANPRGWLNVTSMYFEYTSAASPDLTQEIMGNLEWVKNGTPFGNPERTPKWTKGAAAAIGGEGWVALISMPVYANGQYILLENNNVYPLEISTKLFNTHEQKLLFLDLHTSLLGISPPAKEALGLNELTDFDYIRQMQENAFVQDELKLIHDTQKPGIQELGNKVLAGEKQFEVTIDAQTYTVVVDDIPEVRFYVVGLVKK